jgi:hypothetical protein
VVVLLDKPKFEILKATKHFEKAKMKLLSWKKKWLSSFRIRYFQMIDHFLLSIVFQRKAPGASNPSGLLAQNFESKLDYKSAAALSAACPPFGPHGLTIIISQTSSILYSPRTSRFPQQ